MTTNTPVTLNDEVLEMIQVRRDYWLQHAMTPEQRAVQIILPHEWDALREQLRAAEASKVLHEACHKEQSLKNCRLIDELTELRERLRLAEKVCKLYWNWRGDDSTEADLDIAVTNWAHGGEYRE